MLSKQAQLGLQEILRHPRTCRRASALRRDVARGCPVAALWPPVHGPYIVWVATQAMPFLMKKTSTQKWGHFFLYEAVLSTLWWKLIEITDSMEMHSFCQDICTWPTKIPFSCFWQVRNGDLFLTNSFPDCSCMLTWHHVFASFPNNSKKLLGKYRTCNNTS